MPYVVAIAIGLVGMTIIRNALAFAGAYGASSMTLEWIALLVLGVFLTYLGWFIFKETLTKTYTIRRR
jgi:hypothetical protein